MTENLKKQTFGIEVEMVMSREKAAHIIAEHFGTTARFVGGTYHTWSVPDGQGRSWKLQRDGSITAGDDCQCEFVSPICRWEDIETVQALIRKLREAGAKAHRSCGIHVHIGLGDHTPQTLRNLVNLVNAHEDLLTYSLAISPERRAQWCREVDQRFLERLNRARPRTSEELAVVWYNDTNWERHACEHYDLTRYHLFYVQQVFM